MRHSRKPFGQQRLRRIAFPILNKRKTLANFDCKSLEIGGTCEAQGASQVPSPDQDSTKPIGSTASCRLEADPITRKYLLQPAAACLARDGLRACGRPHAHDVAGTLIVFWSLVFWSRSV